MIFSIKLFCEMPNSWGLSHDLGVYRLKPILKLSPYEIRVSAESRSPQGAQRILGIVRSAALVGNKLPTLRATTTL